MNAEQSIESLYAAGHWLLLQDRFHDAACIFRTMLQAAPTDERGWLALGACHENIDQRRIAAELYRLAETTAAPALRCRIARARALRDEGHDDEADDAYERAIEAAEEHGEEELADLARREREAA